MLTSSFLRNVDFLPPKNHLYKPTEQVPHMWDGSSVHGFGWSTTGHGAPLRINRWATCLGACYRTLPDFEEIHPPKFNSEFSPESHGGTGRRSGFLLGFGNFSGAILNFGRVHFRFVSFFSESKAHKDSCPPTVHRRQWPDLLSTCKSQKFTGKKHVKRASKISGQTNDFVSFKHTTSVLKYSINKV